MIGPQGWQTLGAFLHIINLTKETTLINFKVKVCYFLPCQIDNL